jgi:hypothetical protein
VAKAVQDRGVARGLSLTPDDSDQHDLHEEQRPDFARDHVLPIFIPVEEEYFRVPSRSRWPASLLPKASSAAALQKLLFLS